MAVLGKQKLFGGFVLCTKSLAGSFRCSNGNEIEDTNNLLKMLRRV
jgi:hypothetical protein